jgi:hypothetical protein
MRRPRFAAVLIAVGVATAGAISLAVTPAGAVNACGAPTGQFPNIPWAQTAWKIACTTNAGTLVNNATFADAGNSYFHRGAARTITITAATAGAFTVTGAAGAFLNPADIKRPISGGCIGGGAFIQSIAGNVATLSRANTTPCTVPFTATIEHTYSRVLFNATCTNAGVTSTLAEPNASLDTPDIGKSVSGGPFRLGSRITAVSGVSPNKTATVSIPGGADTNVNPCTNPNGITIGQATYNPSNTQTVVWDSDPMSVWLQNSVANGQAFSCAGSTLTQTAAASAQTQTFNVAYIGLRVLISGGGPPVSRTVAAVTATTMALGGGACPVGVTATIGYAAIGQPGANAPKAQNAAATIGAELSLDSGLVSTADDCANHQFEGVEIVGRWSNPENSLGTGPGYTTTSVSGGPTLTSVGQILFPTSVVSFAGYIRPQRTGGLVGGVPAGSHFEYVLPSLPTSTALCKTGPNPSDPTAVAYGIAGNTPALTPFLPVGSGNPADPPVRWLGPQQPGATNGWYLLKNGAATVNTAALPSCMVQSILGPPTFNCGAG